MSQRAEFRRFFDVIKSMLCALMFVFVTQYGFADVIFVPPGSIDIGNIDPINTGDQIVIPPIAGNGKVTFVCDNSHVPVEQYMPTTGNLIYTFPSVVDVCGNDDKRNGWFCMAQLNTQTDPFLKVYHVASQAKYNTDFTVALCVPALNMHNILHLGTPKYDWNAVFVNNSWKFRRYNNDDGSLNTGSDAVQASVFNAGLQAANMSVLVSYFEGLSGKTERKSALNVKDYISKTSDIFITPGWALDLKCPGESTPIETVHYGNINNAAVVEQYIDQCGPSMANNHELCCREVGTNDDYICSGKYGDVSSVTTEAGTTIIGYPLECEVRKVSCDGKDTFELTVDPTKLGPEEDFKISIDAAGEFIIDWGDGYAEHHKKKVFNTEYNHTYTGIKQRTIKLCGRATGYEDVSKGYAAIAITGGRDALVGVSGSLGKIFPTLDENSLTGRPLFVATFANTTNLKEIPTNLFDGVTGATYGQFYLTFSYSGIESIPENLFNGITGSAEYMFYRTFVNCDNLTRLPNSLFPNITDKPANHMFQEMFSYSDDLGTDSKMSYVPKTLFENLDRTDYTADGDKMKEIFRRTNLTTDCSTIGRVDDDTFDDNFRNHWGLGNNGAAPFAAVCGDCLPGYYLEGGECKECKAGFYCPGGEEKPVSCSSVMYDDTATSDGTSAADAPESCYIPCSDIVLSTTEGDVLKAEEEKVYYNAENDKCKYNIQYKYGKYDNDVDSNNSWNCDVDECCGESSLYDDPFFVKDKDEYLTVSARGGDKYCAPSDDSDVCPEHYVFRSWSRGVVQYDETSKINTIPRRVYNINSSNVNRCFPKQYAVHYNANGGQCVGGLDDNLISAHPAKEWDKKGVKVKTNGDGVYTLNGAVNSGDYVVFTIPVDPFVVPKSLGQGGTGLVALNNNKVANKVLVRFSDESGNVGGYELTSANKSSTEYTAIAGKKIVSFEFYVPKNVQLDNLVVAPAIYRTGNLISAQPANEWEKKGVKVKTNGDGVYTLNGAVNSGDYVVFTIPVDPFVVPKSLGQGGTGLLALNNNKVANKVLVRFSGENGGNIQNGGYELTSANKSSTEYTAIAGKKIVSFEFYVPKNVQLDNLVVAPAIYNDARTEAGDFQVNSIYGQDEDGCKRIVYNVENPSFDLETPVWEGQEFVGWFEQEDLSGDARTIVSPGKESNEDHQDITLYAKWKLNCPAGTYYSGETHKCEDCKANYYCTGVEHILGTNDDKDAGLTSCDDDTDGLFPSTWNKDLNTHKAKTNCLAKVTFNGQGGIVTRTNPDNSGPVAQVGAYYNDKTDPANAKQSCDIDSKKICKSYKDGYFITDGMTAEQPSLWKRDAYDFDGWYLSAECVEEDKVTADRLLTGNQSLYAKWKPIEYNIEYYDSLVEGSITSFALRSDIVPTTYTIEDKITLQRPDKPQNDYDLTWVFGGWYSNADLTTPVSGITEQTEDKIFYAKWMPKTSSIDFVCAPDKIFNKPGQVGAFIDVATSADCGLSFDKWSCGAGAEFNDDETKVRIKDNKLTCKTAYRIDYKGKGIDDNNKLKSDGYTLAPNTYVSGVTTVLPSRESMNKRQARPGYTFTGWFFNPNFTNATTIISGQMSGNKTVYANWTPNTYNMKYDCDSTDAGSTPPPSVNNIYFADEDDEASDANKFTVADGSSCKKDGYTFGGWCDGTVTSGVCSGTTRAAGTEFIWQYPENKVFTAIWEPITYSVTFNANGAEGSMEDQSFDYGEEQALTANAFTQKGYDFNGWCVGATTCAAADKLPDGASVSNLTTTDGATITLYAQWNLIEYNIVYDLDGGTQAADYIESYSLESFADNPESKIILKKPAKDNYTFAGWCLVDEEDGALSDCDLEQYISLDHNFGQTHFAAKWTPTEYTITYKVLKQDDEWTSEVLSPAIYNVETDNTDIALPDTITASRQGFEFAGWCLEDSYLNPSCETVSLTDLLEHPSDTITLYAKWAPVSQDIKYYVYYFDEDYWQDETLQPSKYDITSGTISLATPDNRDGYLFAGWCKGSADCETTITTFTPVPADLDAPLKLYAKWVEAPSYTITYVLNCNSGEETETATYTYGEGLESLLQPTCPHWDFAGWYKDEDLSGAAVESISDTESEDIILYAKWNFKCESGRWLHVGNGANDRMCLYDTKMSDKALGVMVEGAPYYVLLSQQTTTDSKKINQNSNVKLHVQIDNTVYNAHDASVE